MCVHTCARVCFICRGRGAMEGHCMGQGNNCDRVRPSAEDRAEITSDDFEPPLIRFPLEWNWQE